MEFVRKAVLVLITPIFLILLLVAASNTATLMVATNPDTIKSVISRSDIYGSVVPGLLDEAGQISSGGEQVSLGNEIVRQAAGQTFTGEFIQRHTEAVIDSIYVWLNGGTPLPDFQVDLTEAKTNFAARVGDGVEARLATLPACVSTADSAQAADDPINAACLPSGADPASLAATVEQNIVSGTGFIDHPVITAETIKQENDSQSLFKDELKDIPEIYQKIELLPLVLGALSLLFALAIIFLSSSRRAGVRLVGIILVVVGVFLVALAFALPRLIDSALKDMDLANNVLEDKLRILLAELAKEVDKIYWIFGGAYTLLGVLAIVWAVRHKPRGGKPDKDDLEGEGRTPEDRIDLKEPENVSKLAKDEPAAKPKPKPAPKPAPKKQPAKKITIQ